MFRFLLLIFIVMVNAFFAAAEVALLSTRRSRLLQLANGGNVGAQAAVSLLENPERLLSVVQVGVTLASLALGWAGEDTLFGVLQILFQPLVTPQLEPLFHGLAFGLAFAIMTFLHVVLGEVVPKNLAIEKADRLAILVAPPLLVFARISSPFVALLEKSASLVSRLIGLSGESHGGGHSPEELKMIVAAARSEGHLREFENEAIQRLLELGDVSAREIMVPRNRIIGVSLDAKLDEVLRLFLDHQFSRLPVYEKSPEHIVGFVHYKDLLRVWEERKQAIERRRPIRPFRLDRILRKPMVIPESKGISELIEEFKKTRNHMAVVVDEFGTVAGLLTLEDVLEQIFGEMEDEHDERRLEPPPSEALSLEIDGATPIRDLESLYGISLPLDSGFETLAGFLLSKFGAIPEPGQVTIHDSRRFTVMRMDRNRISWVKVERLAPAAAADGGQPA